MGPGSPQSRTRRPSRSTVSWSATSARARTRAGPRPPPFWRTALQQTVSVQVLGDERLITGETVVVEEPETGLQGIFWIDADSHTWARGQYTCRLTLNCRSVMATAGAGSEL